MRIVETFDVLEHRRLCFGMRPEVMSVQQLAFQAREEALGHGVVETVYLNDFRKFKVTCHMSVTASRSCFTTPIDKAIAAVGF